MPLPFVLDGWGEDVIVWYHLVKFRDIFVGGGLFGNYHDRIESLLDFMITRLGRIAAFLFLTIILRCVSLRF